MTCTFHDMAFQDGDSDDKYIMELLISIDMLMYLRRKLIQLNCQRIFFSKFISKGSITSLMHTCNSTFR
jgi:hypothetical protein